MNINNKSKHIRLHSNSILQLRILEFKLSEKGIACLIKENSQSAISAGFGYNDNDNDLFVFEEDFDKAQLVLKQFLKDNKI
jgi:hypothetical protein